MPRRDDELSRIRASILERRAQRAGDIADGKCTSFDSYKHEVGYVSALDFALEEITRITGSDGED